MAEQIYSDLVQQVLTRMSMVNGTGVQVYSEEKIIQYFIACYKQLLMDKEFPWDLQYDTRTLNGTDGKITSVINNVTKPTNLLAVYRQDSDRPIPMLPRSVNPLRISGTMPLYLQLLPRGSDLLDDAAGRYLFRLWPSGATGDVIVVTQPDHLITADRVVTLDDEALTLYACAMHESSDGANPAQAQVFMRQYETYIENMKRRSMGMAVSKNPKSISYLQDWTDPDVEGW